MSASNSVVIPSNMFAADKVTAEAIHKAGLVFSGRFAVEATFAQVLIVANGGKPETAKKIANGVASELGAIFSDSRLDKAGSGKKGLTFATKGEKAKEITENVYTRLAFLAVHARELANVGVKIGLEIRDIEGLAELIAKLETAKES